MTTPSIFTPYGVITDAYRDAGKLQLGDDLTGEQLADGMRRLRDWINFCQVKGLKLWTWADTTVPLTAGTAAYTFMPSGSVDMTKPLKVLQAFYLYDDNNARRPLTVLSMNDYYTLGMAGTLTTNRGTISQYYVEKLYDRLKVTFWLCPDSTEADNGDVHLILQTQITNPTELDETMQFPPEWRLAARWGLAADLATGQPQAVIDRCEAKAGLFLEALENWDVEDAPMELQADPRTGVAGNFR